MIADAPDQPTASTPTAQARSVTRLISNLQQENEQLRAENSELRGVVSVDKIKAELIAPYATKVFRFLIGYCVIVAVILLLDGFKYKDFSLNDAVLSIIAGSTAVAAIGLVGIVVRGLFGPNRTLEQQSEKSEGTSRTRRRSS